MSAAGSTRHGDRDAVRALAAAARIPLTDDEAASIGETVLEWIDEVDEVARRWGMKWTAPHAAQATKLEE